MFERKNSNHKYMFLYLSVKLYTTTPARLRILSHGRLPGKSFTYITLNETWYPEVFLKTLLNFMDKDEKKHH